MAEERSTITQVRAITLSREYGSGGGEIAERLAQRLHWQLIDHEVVTRVAKRLGVSEAEVAEHDERADSLAARILNSLRFVQPIVPVSYDVDVPAPMSSHVFYEAQSQVIDGAVAAGHVVIVGRGAQAHLASQRDVFHVRIVAPLEARVTYVIRREGRDQANARDRILHKDEERGRYLQMFYKQHPSDAHLYDLILNTAVLDLDSAVDVIALAVERKDKRLAIPLPELGPSTGLAPYPGQPEDFLPHT
ncbi:MAG: cytidylate kinase-like family protein [Herpetosiphonaceae bacterium]|nr:cytidylate kinase-like family protein [Herpetosiphonaceae bacterium]